VAPAISWSPGHIAAASNGTSTIRHCSPLRFFIQKTNQHPARQNVAISAGAVAQKAGTHITAMVATVTANRANAEVFWSVFKASASLSRPDAISRSQSGSHAADLNRAFPSDRTWRPSILQYELSRVGLTGRKSHVTRIPVGG
jgi:hypothetical protein